MYKGLFYKASIDGIISGIILNIILDFSLSSCAKDFLVFEFISLGAIAAILVSVFFFLLIKGIMTFRGGLFFGIISTILCAITIVLHIMLPVDFFPMREATTGDGMLILAMASIYLFLSLILKSSFLLLGIIRGQFAGPGDGLPEKDRN